MFENLIEKFNLILKKLRGQARITAENIEPCLKEIRLSLLEADVNYKVVKEFVDKVKAEALGEEVAASLTPGQKMVKIIYDQMKALLSSGGELNLSASRPAIVMMVGLQGSGKTTTAAKLALFLKGKGKKAGLVAADFRRPAAREQLAALAGQLDMPVWLDKEISDYLDFKDRILSWAKENNLEVVLIDTAGRLHLDQELMGELLKMKEAFNPQEVILAIDAMTGQEAVKVARAFEERLNLTGLILTKLDGDTRGGAALSMRAAIQKPIKFVGVGERLNDLEPFYPERMASRILGMGDILTLVEKVEQEVTAQEKKAMERKLRRFDFNLEDFLAELKRIKRMGPLEDLLKMMPGGNKLKISFSENDLKHMEAIISSMTVEERRNPLMINGSRRDRLSRGSGRPTTEINRLLNQFAAMKKMWKRLPGMGKMFKSQGGLS